MSSVTNVGPPNHVNSNPRLLTEHNRLISPFVMCGTPSFRALTAHTNLGWLFSSCIALRIELITVWLGCAALSAAKRPFFQQGCATDTLLAKESPNALSSASSMVASAAPAPASPSPGAGNGHCNWTSFWSIKDSPICKFSPKTVLRVPTSSEVSLRNRVAIP